MARNLELKLSVVENELDEALASAERRLATIESRTANAFSKVENSNTQSNNGTQANAAAEAQKSLTEAVKQTTMAIVLYDAKINQAVLVQKNLIETTQQSVTIQDENEKQLEATAAAQERLIAATQQAIDTQENNSRKINEAAEAQERLFEATKQSLNAQQSNTRSLGDAAEAQEQLIAATQQAMEVEKNNTIQTNEAAEAQERLFEATEKAIAAQQNTKNTPNQDNTAEAQERIAEAQEKSFAEAQKILYEQIKITEETNATAEALDKSLAEAQKIIYEQIKITAETNATAEALDKSFAEAQKILYEQIKITEETNKTEEALEKSFAEAQKILYEQIKITAENKAAAEALDKSFAEAQKILYEQIKITAETNKTAEAQERVTEAAKKSSSAQQGKRNNNNTDNTAEAQERVAEATERTGRAQSHNSAEAARHAQFLRNEGATLEDLQAKYQNITNIINRLSGMRGMSLELAEAHREAAELANELRQVTTEEAKQVELLRAASQHQVRADRLQGTSISETEHVTGTHRGLIQGLATGLGLDPDLMGSLTGSGGGKGAVAAAGGLAAGGLAMAGIQAIGMKLVEDFSILSEKTKELSKTFSDGGGPLDKLSDSTRRLQEAQTKAANSPAMAKVNTALNEFGIKLIELSSNVIGALVDRFTSDEDKAKNAKKKEEGQLTLKGEAQQELKALGAERLKMEEEIADERLRIEKSIATQRQALAQDVADFEFDAARKRQDLEIKRASIEADFEDKKTAQAAKKEQMEDDANFQSQIAAKEFALDRMHSRERENIRKDSDARNHALSQQEALESSMFAKREQQNRRSDMVEDAQSAIQNASDPIARRKAIEDANKQISRLDRDNALKQEQEQAKQKQGGKRFDAEQQDKSEAFQQAEKEAVAQREIDIAKEVQAYKSMEAQLAIETIGLERQHQEAIAENSLAMQRLTEDIDRAHAAFEERGRAIDEDEKQQLTDLEKGAGEKRANQTKKEGEFVKGLQGQLTPEMMAQLEKSNPEIKEMRKKSFEQANPNKSFADEEKKRQDKLDDEKFQKELDQRKEKVAKETMSVVPQTLDPFGVIKGIQEGIHKSNISNEDVMTPEEKEKAAAKNNTNSASNVAKAAAEGVKKALPAIPKYQDGGTVSDTGLAFIHKNEIIINPDGNNQAEQRAHFLNAGKRLGMLDGNGGRPQASIGSQIADKNQLGQVERNSAEFRKAFGISPNGTSGANASLSFGGLTINGAENGGNNELMQALGSQWQKTTEDFAQMVQSKIASNRKQNNAQIEKQSAELVSRMAFTETFSAKVSRGG